MRLLLCLLFFLAPLLTVAATGELAGATADYRQLGYDNGLFTLTGQPFSGLAVQTNRAGQVVARRSFKAGRFEGVTEEFHTNGTLIVRTAFEAGERHGTNTYWNTDGSLLKRQRWEHGQLVESTHREDLP